MGTDTEGRLTSSLTLSVVELVDDTLVAEMEVGELAVAVLQSELDGARGARRPAADLGDAELEAMWQIGRASCRERV